MVKVFQKWTRVKDVFISRRLNKWGRRFSFVSFFGVKDEGRLERELDLIYIGSRKLHENIPKYRRHQYGRSKEERRVSRELPRESQKSEGKRYLKEAETFWKHGDKGIWREKNRNRSYVDVVTGDLKSRGRA